ncbi:MAG: YCF48-related protein [bacterium]|nr:YCF48-related protein [bacterium]
MKKIVIFLAMSLLVSIMAMGQENWHWQNPIPQGNQLYDIWLFNDQAAVAVGEVGTIIKTTNGGSSWTVAHYSGGVDSDLYAVCFADQLNGWAAGTNGKILKTVDGGANWASKTIINVNEIKGIFFHDALNGWAVGNRIISSTEKRGVLLKTTNGGDTWTVLETTNASTLNAIQFSSTNVGWAVGSSYVADPQNAEDIILKTQDGGTTWTPYYSKATLELYSVSFVDDLHGWAVGDGNVTRGSVIHTADGGASWVTQTQPEPTNALWAIHFKDQNLGWAVGERGVLIQTNNGGQLWEADESQVERNINSIKFASPDVVMAVGNAGIIIRSDDDGAVWKEVSIGTYIWNIYGVDFINPDIGWVVGPNKKIMKSTDGGKTWSLQASSGSETLHEILFVNDQKGWTVGEMGLILHTTDGGTSWIEQTSNTKNFLQSLFFINDQTGWICGGPLTTDSSIILKTMDGGATWTKQNCPGTATLHDIYFVDSQIGWAVGENGNVTQTTDGGTTWSCIPTGRTEDFYTVHFISQAIGWICGNSILKTIDGGTNWTEQMLFSANDKVREVYFMDSMVGWAVIQGIEGALYKTIDGGSTWFKLEIGTRNGLYDIDIIDNQVGWIVGTNSSIIKTDVIVVPVELASFDAMLKNGRVELNWTTASESNNYGFEIQRQRQPMNAWQKVGFIAGNGTTTAMNSYTFTDQPDAGGKYDYRLKQIDLNGKFQFSSTRVVIIPSKFALHQNQPNPFNPETSIGFELPVNAHVTLEIYNMLGQKIATLIDERRPAGFQKIIWNGKDDLGRQVGSGVYFYRIKSDRFEATRKLVLLR